MSLILCIETATVACSVALISNEQITGSRNSVLKNAHSSVLSVYIDELIQTSGFRYSSLDAVAVSKGPGSYTGLRIGVSTAKGLCYALDIPLIAIDTLQCMASGFITGHDNIAGNAMICPMIDARRMEVFTAVYNTSLQPLVPVSAMIVDDLAYSNLTKGKPVYYFGDGAEKCMMPLSKRPGWNYIPGFVNSATHFAPLATEYYKQSRFEDNAYFEPFYLKDFIAGKPKVKGLY